MDVPSAPRKPFKTDPFSSRNGSCLHDCMEVTLAETRGRCSDRSRPSQQSRRKEKDGSQERQDTFHSDTNDPKRQQNEPNKGINHKCKQRERPAEEKQDAPQDESDHDDLLATYYARARPEVPSAAKAFSLSLRAIDTGTSASSSMWESSTSECSTRPSA